MNSSLTSLADDAKYAARSLGRHPRRSALVVSTLAIGIGATTALFSVVHAVLLKPLPWPHSARLVRLAETRDSATRHWPWRFTSRSYQAWAERAETVEGLAAWGGCSGGTLTEAGEPTLVRCMSVTASLFGLLEARMIAGAPFTAEDERSGGVVVLAERLWEERFGRNPDAVGRVVRLGGEPHRIVGVVADDFAFPDRETRIWTPLVMPPVVEGGGMWLISALARLRPGIAPQRAAREAEALAARMPQPGPVELAMFGARGAPRISATPLLASMTEEVRPALLLLLAAAVLLLLAATANVAGLQLAAATARRRELAVRSAIGAGRGRLARQLLCESLLTGGAAGAVGLALAAAVQHALPALLPADFPRLGAIGVDLRVVAFNLALAAAAGTGVALLPALAAGRLRLSEVLAEHGAGSVGAGRSGVAHTRSWILAGQVAVAAVLLLGSVQLARSFYVQLSADRGFSATGLFVVELQMPKALYTPERRAALVTALLDRLRASPGVAHAGIGNMHPLSDSVAMAAFPLRPRGDGDERAKVQATVRLVSPGYLEALGRRRIAGRFFDERDRTRTAPTLVVNRTFAERYLDEPAVGSMVGNFDDLPDRQVVGVVEDTRPAALASLPQPEVLSLVPLLDGLQLQHLSVLVRSRGNPGALPPTLRSVLRELDPGLAASPIRAMDDVLADGLAQPRLYSTLVGAFAACALIIVGVGLFAVLSYTVSLRRREIGVRVALGARPVDVVALVTGRGLALACAGLVAGLAVSLAGGRILERFLFGVRPNDAVGVVSVTIALAVAALLASALPALRAARLDPGRALRDS